MGKKSDVFTAYLGRAENLADLYNGCLYGGKQVILPDQLAEIQKVYHEPLTDRYGRKTPARRERDIAKGLFRNGKGIILAVELQDRNHYYMPLRIVEYDIAELKKQLRRKKEQYKKEGGLKTREEYLSGIKETDRLIPTVTLVLYHGEGTWTAARELGDLQDTSEMDKKLRHMMLQYRMHVVNLSELDETLFKSGLRELIGMMKRKNNKEEMWAYCRENEERFGKMDEDTYDLICTMLNMRSLVQNKEKNRNEKEKTWNMCKAFEDMVKDSREEGRKIGIEEGKKLGQEKGEKRGEKRFGALVARLIADGRLEEITKAVESVRVRKRLYREYGIG